jgi:hypothetical protein
VAPNPLPEKDKTVTLRRVSHTPQTSAAAADIAGLLARLEAAEQFGKIVIDWRT